MKEDEIIHLKKSYEAPQIYQVVITPDELATTGCKSVMINFDVCANGSVDTNRQQGS